jgi:hypothetical protein
MIAVTVRLSMDVARIALFTRDPFLSKASPELWRKEHENRVKFEAAHDHEHG